MNRVRRYLASVRDRIQFQMSPFRGSADSRKIEQGFIFIIGASGSGTTMLTRILSGPDEVIGLGGNFDALANSDRAARYLARMFKEATKNLWDRKASFARHEDSKRALRGIVHELFGLATFEGATRILHKRSAPFWIGDRYRPDLVDLFDLFVDPKIIVVYRDPKASTYSSLRRGFSRHLRESAVICEEQLTYLNAQLRALPGGSYFVLNYEAFCARPTELMRAIAAFVELDAELLETATMKENVTPIQIDRWRNSLSAGEVQYLEAFFTDRRQAQWSLLSGANAE